MYVYYVCAVCSSYAISVLVILNEVGSRYLGRKSRKSRKSREVHAGDRPQWGRGGVEKWSCDRVHVMTGVPESCRWYKYVLLCLDYIVL